MSDPNNDTDAVVALREEALRDLEQVSQGAPLCRVGPNDGRNMKYFEGRYSALSELLKSDRSTWAAIAAMWHREFLRHAKEDSGSPWTMYRSGGVDAFTELGLITSTGAIPFPGAAGTAQIPEQ